MGAGFKDHCGVVEHSHISEKGFPVFTVWMGDVISRFVPFSEVTFWD
jgi:hypothetical protein